MISVSPVLVSWVAVNDDPYERSKKTGEFLQDGGQPVPGATLTGTISTKFLERNIRSYVALKSRRIAKERALSVEDLCDVTERSLRTWASGGSELPRSESWDPEAVSARLLRGRS